MESTPTLNIDIHEFLNFLSWFNSSNILSTTDKFDKNETNSPQQHAPPPYVGQSFASRMQSLQNTSLHGLTTTLSYNKQLHSAQLKRTRGFPLVKPNGHRGPLAFSSTLGTATDDTGQTKS
jgi:hypothetical protein